MHGGRDEAGAVVVGRSRLLLSDSADVVLLAAVGATFVTALAGSTLHVVAGLLVATVAAVHVVLRERRRRVRRRLSGERRERRRLHLGVAVALAVLTAATVATGAAVVEAHLWFLARWHVWCAVLLLPTLGLHLALARRRIVGTMRALVSASGRSAGSGDGADR